MPASRKKRVIVRVARDERPASTSKFRPWMRDVAGRMARLGDTDRAIANRLGVAYSTFRDYVSKDEKLQVIMLRDKAVADARVEMSLFELTQGFDYYEEEVKIVEGQIVKVEVRRHKAPETAACINWLANRTEWRRNPDTLELPAPEVAVNEERPVTRDDYRRIALVLFKADKGMVN